VQILDWVSGSTAVGARQAARIASIEPTHVARSYDFELRHALSWRRRCVPRKSFRPGLTVLAPSNAARTNANRLRWASRTIGPIG